MQASINRFSDDYYFLSNYYPSSITYLGYQFPTVEHMYQGLKFSDPDIIHLFELYPSPEDAKYAGRHLPDIRADWEDSKLVAMLTAVRLKFQQHPDLAAMLISTGDTALIESNHHNDTFWGVCNGVGDNHLGQILMQIREELSHETTNH